MLPGPATALATLFQDSKLDIELDDAIERTGRAFFDQILVPTIVLRLPASPKVLPPPKSSSEAPAFLLPIRTPFPGSSPDGFSTEPSPAFPSEYEHDEHDASHDHDDEHAPDGGDRNRPSVPRLLRTLLSLIRIQVDGTYAVSRVAAARSVPTSTVPVPSVRAEDQQLFKAQSAAAEMNGPGGAAEQQQQQQQRPSALVPFHTQSWAGNKNGRPAVSSAVQGSSSKAKDSRDGQEKERGQITFESDSSGKSQDGRWVVRWSCEVPVSFMQLPSMTPALSLTASLSLLLSSTQLALLFDIPAPIDVFVGDQDLLSALSEGPVYPGESPSDRAQRTKSSLARLPLSQLSAQVIGTKLLTPQNAAREIKGRSSRGLTLPPPPDAVQDDPEDAFDGDLSSRRPSATPSQAGASSGAKPAPPFKNAFSQTTSGTSDTGPSPAFSRERRVLKRSFLRILDVSSAVSVRLRTVLSPERPATFGSSLSEPDPQLDDAVDGDDDGMEPYDEDSAGADAAVVTSAPRLERYPFDDGGALLLCVELDHPLSPAAMRNAAPSFSTSSRAFGQLSFEIINVKIDVLEPNSQLAMNANANGSVVHAVKPAVNETLRATLFDPQQALQDDKTESGGSHKGSSFPFVLTEGQQRNLVYCVDFIDPIPTMAEPGRADSRPPSALTFAPGQPPADVSPVRQVNIVVEARPLLRRSQVEPYKIDGDHQEAGDVGNDKDATPDADILPSFSSAWNCTVDIATARTNLRRRNEVRLGREQRERMLLEEQVPVYLATSA
ncbi:unnamed protein product [Tilletia controversa]|uniref:Uncharacterized protein n=3 Tax=Tilletia TaxID=13289 RepID=A0A8X7SV96_9BASI|nr:hypothetical protein A4X06_0g6437 [Tilletia controversa]KAE8256779.1 hypothetical protein A4X03_0g5068 [Tilletia caries]CAD6912221.1 unnamed protein product [Tilletia laevis]CAD6897330.1 unnamed protein product [Tilletia caries]CAD6904396.1 unnamed protein product [Tilletia controversa]